MKPLTIGGHSLAWGSRTYLMGIINVTEDSFSGDGLLKDPSGASAAMEQVRRFVASGVDILDIGGESTRPGAFPVDEVTEKERVIPVIHQISSEFPNALISIDTYKAGVAEEALQAGAHIVNDVWGLRADPHLARVTSDHEAPIILMHNRSKPAKAEIQENLGGRYIGMEYQDLLQDVKNELMESVKLALDAGIPREKIILDPGIGFGKTVEQNLELLDRLNEIRQLGFPVLLGPSRKSFIGYTLDLPTDERVEGTAAAVSVGITRGADIVRVHDVEYMARVVRMADAIVRRS
ncbi:MAG: dihydropteroate synthase [Anaerolineales bacterium]